MSTTIVIPFTITRWDASVYDAPAEGPPLSRVIAEKSYRGALEGTGKAEVLIARNDAGAGYLALERVEGSLAGRRGTFVIQHGGLSGGGSERTFGDVVPGSGTGELRGLSGQVVFAHYAEGARLTLTYALAG